MIARPIDQLRPDPNQPRKVFSDEYLSGLSKSLSVEGMINPIEIDEGGMIITGECRWKAAKMAGWTEVPVNVNGKELPEYERFRRQMAENLHQSSAGETAPMNPIDVANGYKKLLEMKGHPIDIGATPSVIGQDVARKDYDLGISDLSRELGVSERKISDYLNLLWEPKYVLESIAKDKTKFSLYDEARRVPEKYKEGVKKAISEGKLKGERAVRRFAQLAKVRPDKAELEFLRITEQQSSQANRILDRTLDLQIILKQTDPSKFSPQDYTAVFSALGSVAGAIRGFLGKMKKGVS